MILLFRDNFKGEGTMIGASWDDESASSTEPGAARSTSGEASKYLSLSGTFESDARQPHLVVMTTTNLGFLPRLQSLAGSYQIVTAKLPTTLTVGPCLIEGTPAPDPDGIWSGVKNVGGTLSWLVKKRIGGGAVANIFTGFGDIATILGGTPDTVRIGLGYRMLVGGGARVWLDCNGVKLGEAVDSTFNDPSLTLRPGIATDVNGGSARIWEYALYGLKL